MQINYISCQPECCIEMRSIYATNSYVPIGILYHCLYRRRRCIYLYFSGGGCSLYKRRFGLVSALARDCCCCCCKGNGAGEEHVHTDDVRTAAAVRAKARASAESWVRDRSSQKEIPSGCCCCCCCCCRCEIQFSRISLSWEGSTHGERRLPGLWIN